jgi:signal transduction histidine kinase
MANTTHEIGSGGSQPTLAADHQVAAGAALLNPADRSTSTDDLLDRLTHHRTIGAAPREELDWLIRHGQLEHFKVGDIVSSTTAPVRGMFVILTGRISIHVSRGGARHKLSEWQAGDVTGLLPYSRLGAPPGETVVDEPVDSLTIAREEVPAMTRECHELTSILVHLMLDRTRFFNSSQLHDEKLKSLGKLAAGLAHELNNPASAIKRSAKLLWGELEAAEAAARAIGAAGLTPAELARIAEMTAACTQTPLERVLSPLEESEREAAIADWLESRGIDADAADVVAQSPLTLEALDKLVELVHADRVEPVLRWIAADCSVRGLAREIEQAGTRISDLVSSVRGFTQVDAAAVPQEVEIGEGLRQTLAVLKGKARARSVRMGVNVEDSLPRVRGVAAELNQVWANLIDNAIDAVPDGGSVEVVAGREGKAVIVRVIDNGSGIPDDVRDRIFDPFFTTKDVGKGTGLGLDIVRRLVVQHDGDIDVQSRPGRTEFRVTLPIVDGHDRGGTA